VRTFFLFILQLIFTVVSFAQDIRVQSHLSDFSFDSVLVNVKQLSGELPVTVNGNAIYISSRLYNDIGNEQTFQWVKENFSRFGLEIDSMAFSTNGKNLFGIKYGDIFPERVCILGAHYDNLPTGGIAPGADDNASGTAVVLEAARILSNHQFPNTVIFALWDEEELGLFGSTAFANNFNISTDSLLGYINLDMIAWDGNFDDRSEIHVRPIANSLHLANIADKANLDYDIGLNLEIVNPGSSNTDHAPFWLNNLSAIGISEEYQGDFNPFWHTLGDTLGNFNVPYYERNARLAVSTFATLAYNKSGNQTMNEIINNAILFPNPSENNLLIEFSSAVTVNTTIEITNIYGEIIYKSSVVNFDLINLNFSNYPSGIYFINLTAPGINKIFKMEKI
jgi:Zn-dependent M28 family amino/carboxypeptidase